MNLASRSEFSPKEVARLLSSESFSVSTRAVLRMIERGELRAWRQNARVLRIARTDLEAYIRSRFTTPENAAGVVRGRREVTQVSQPAAHGINSGLTEFVASRGIAAR